MILHSSGARADDCNVDSLMTRLHSIGATNVCIAFKTERDVHRGINYSYWSVEACGYTTQAQSVCQALQWLITDLETSGACGQAAVAAEPTKHESQLLR